MMRNQAGALRRLLAVALLCAMNGHIQAQEPLAEFDTVCTSQYDARNVHVFLCESPVDPLHFCGLPRLKRQLVRAGVPNCVVIESACRTNLADTVRELKCSDPESRVVLVGWSGGSLKVYDAVESLQLDGVVVDKVVYIDSNWIESRAKHGHPANVGQVVLIYRENHDPPECLYYNRIYRVPAKQHLAVPTCSGTLGALIMEVQQMCACDSELTRCPETGAAPATD